jgi:flagellar motor component MotA
MPTKPTWTAIKKELQNFDAADLVELIKQLYDLSTQNKAMLMSVVDKTASLEALEAPVMREIEKAFDPPRGYPSCKTGAARKAMRQYVKVAPFQEAVAIQLHFVEMGIRCTTKYGDIDEQFYISIETVFEEVLKQIKQQKAEANYLLKLKKIVQSTSGMGWGFHDQLSDLYDLFVEDLEISV